MKRISLTKILTAAMFILMFSLTNVAIAGKSKLVGHWIGGSLNITIKANQTYKFKILKIISVKGQWTANKNTLTLNYSSFGKKKKKVATYHFKGKDLVLRMTGKKAVILKKQ